MGNFAPSLKDSDPLKIIPNLLENDTSKITIILESTGSVTLAPVFFMPISKLCAIMCEKMLWQPTFSDVRRAVCGFISNLAV